MKMVPKTDPLGCFLYNFDPHCPKKTTTHNTTNFLFRNLGPKTRFPFTLWPTTTWNPQPTTHPFWMDLLLFWDNILDRCLRMLFLYSTQGSDKICQDLQRSAKICQDQTRSTKGSASTNLQAPLAETNHETPSSKNEGAAVSRRMASSIKKLYISSCTRASCFLAGMRLRVCSCELPNVACPSLLESLC